MSSSCPKRKWRTQAIANMCALLIFFFSYDDLTIYKWCICFLFSTQSQQLFASSCFLVYDILHSYSVRLVYAQGMGTWKQVMAERKKEMVFVDVFWFYFDGLLCLPSEGQDKCPYEFMTDNIHLHIEQLAMLLV